MKSQTTRLFNKKMKQRKNIKSFKKRRTTQCHWRSLM